MVWTRHILWCGLAWLGGCTALPDWLPLGASTAPPEHAAGSTYDFSWRLSGHRATAPQQVFDNGRSMWLQFAPGQAVPAIFARQSDGDILLQAVRQGPYMVLDRVWPRLVLRGGHYETLIERQLPVPSAAAAAGADATAQEAQGSQGTQGTQAVQAAQAAQEVQEVQEVQGAQAASAALAASRAQVESAVSVSPAASPAAAPTQRGEALSAGRVLHGHAPATADLSSVPPAAAASLGPSAGSGLPPGHTEMSAAQPQALTATGFHVTEQDRNLRLALARWAKDAGWTFLPEHWAVDVDIPIAGAAHFDMAFELAVQELMAATEMSEHPLQPCFYANKVLRIVPYAQVCNRAATEDAP